MIKLLSGFLNVFRFWILNWVWLNIQYKMETFDNRTIDGQWSKPIEDRCIYPMLTRQKLSYLTIDRKQSKPNQINSQENNMISMQLLSYSLSRSLSFWFWTKCHLPSCCTISVFGIVQFEKANKSQIIGCFGFDFQIEAITMDSSTTR